MKFIAPLIAVVAFALTLSFVYSGHSVTVRPISETTTQTSQASQSTPGEVTETQIWCGVYPHYFDPPPNHTLRAHCEFDRLDISAGEAVYRVWMTDHGPRGTKIYFSCVWFDGNQETNFIRVGRVGETHGTVC